MLIINGIEYSDDSFSETGYEIIAHAGSAVLTAADMKKYHRSTAAGTITLPTITALMVSNGDWIIIAKRTTGNVSVSRGGSDVIIEAGTTSLANNNADENWASIKLVAEQIGVWGIENQFGTWLS